MTDSVIERAQRLRVRSQELREHSELLSQQTVERLRLVDAPPFGASGNNFALRIARIRPAVALLRDCLGRWLESRGVDRERGHEIVLACSEACANAIEHPLADSYAVEVEASHRAGEVVVVVRDFGRWRPERASDARGRGLQMMRSLMSEVDVRQGETGTEIVMRERLD